MSSRQLRKLQQQRELEQAKLQAQAEEEESEEEPVVPAKSKASLFANLATLEDEAEEDEPEEEEEPEENVKEEIAPPSASKKPKKSKKKKKGKKSKDKVEEKEEHADGIDDIDAALAELAAQKPAGKSNAWDSLKLMVDPEYERVCELLGVSAQHLKVGNEMKNLFGKEAVEVNEEPGGPAGRGGRRRQRAQQQQVDLETALKGHHAPGKGLSELTLRRNTLIQGKDDWPRATTGGLTMELVDDKADDGTVEFRYVHDAQYQSVQQAFYGFVEMGVPQNLIGLLTRNPYHISLLIQVSKIAKDQSDHSLASDLLERALFTFGRAATSLFNTKLSQGKARLDFARPENREIWLAGYHYIRSLVQKGTYRTALEWAKLLLSLDPEGDPYCMRLMIHHLAIRARENKWLLDVAESEIPDIWAPSYKGKSLAASHTTPSLAFAALQLRESKKCRELLTSSMQKLPWLFARLLSEMNLDVPKTLWGITPRTDAETLFTEMYVLQMKDIWNTPEATALLMEIAHTIPKVQESKIPKLENPEMTLDVVRFVYLDNTPALMSHAPSHLLHRSNNSDSDPLPPDVNIFSYAAQRMAIEKPDGDRGGDFDDGFFDPIAAMARMLPNLYRRAPEEEEGGVENYGDALREALDEIANDGLGDDDEDDDDEEPDPSAIRPSVARRILNMLWGPSDPLQEDDEDENEDDGTDDEVPELEDVAEERR